MTAASTAAGRSARTSRSGYTATGAERTARAASRSAHCAAATNNWGTALATHGAAPASGALATDIRAAFATGSAGAVVFARAAASGDSKGYYCCE